MEAVAKSAVKEQLPNDSGGRKRARKSLRAEVLTPAEKIVNEGTMDEKKKLKRGLYWVESNPTMSNAKKLKTVAMSISTAAQACAERFLPEADSEASSSEDEGR